MYHQPQMYDFSSPISSHSRPVKLVRGRKPIIIPWPEEFPTELVFEIFKYFNQSDLAKACRVSKYCILSPY